MLYKIAAKKTNQCYRIIKCIINSTNDYRTTKATFTSSMGSVRSTQIVRNRVQLIHLSLFSPSSMAGSKTFPGHSIAHVFSMSLQDRKNKKLQHAVCSGYKAHS